MEEIKVTGLCDSHFHIEEMLKKDINVDEILTKWNRSGGLTLIDIGVDENDYGRRFQYADKYNFIKQTIGIHPNNTGGNLESRMRTLEDLLIGNKSVIVGIGETGLDYYWDTVDKFVQQSFFAAHLELAKKYNKPVIIHNRDASSDIYKILSKYKGEIKGIIHCFSATPEYVKKFVELGFYISFAGNVTYKKNVEIQESLKHVPLDRLLIETDSPYLSPVPKRGRLNTPNHIIFTFNYIEKYLKVKNLKKVLEKNLTDIFML